MAEENPLIYFDQDEEEENILKDLNSQQKSLENYSLASHASDFASSQALAKLNDSQKSSSTGLKRQAELADDADEFLNDLESDLIALNHAKKRAKLPLAPLFTRDTTDKASTDDELPEPPRAVPQTNEYRFKPPGKRYIQCRSDDGLLYIPIRRRHSIFEIENEQKALSGECLIETSVHSLMQEIYLESQEKQKTAILPRKSRNRQLWVDKYAPQQFSDLIGDGKTLREVLGWVRGWDYAVFRKETPFTHPQKHNPPVKPKLEGLSKNREAFENAQYERSLAAYRRELFELRERSKDKLRRPLRKVLLVSGAPGIGKTTIAHVVADHVGYQVCEINASDERGGEQLENKLTGALQSQDIRTNKPNLVILDEIDGAIGVSDHSSFNLIRFLVKAASEARDQKQALKRPIICLCNNLYAPALKPLRAVAHCLQLRAPAPRQLAQRLLEICETEGLRTDMQAMMTLSEITQGDMRSCLHSLQFYSQKSDRLRVDNLKELDLGAKDTKQALFSTISAILTRDVSRKPKKAHLAQLVEQNSEYERLAEAVFEVYPKTKGADSFALSKSLARGSSIVPATLSEMQHLPRIVQAQEWFYFFSCVAHRALHMNQWSFGWYLSVPFLAFHRLFASVTGSTRPEYPRAARNAFLVTEHSKQLLNSFVAGASVPFRAFWEKRIVRTDLLSLLLGVMDPHVQAPSPHTLRPEEARQIRRTLALLKSFNLKLLFASESEAVGRQLQVDPDIKELLLSSGHSVFGQFNPAMQQHLFAEYQKGKRAGPAKLSEKIRNVYAESAPPEPAVAAKRAKSLQEYFISKMPSAPLAAAHDTATSSDLKALSRNVWYRYNEGYSNAVRKPAVLNEFF